MIQNRPDKNLPWVGRVYTTDGREVSKSFRRKIDAERWVEDQRVMRRRGEWVDPSRGDITWDKYLRSVLDTKAHLSPRTLETYEQAAFRVEPWLTGLPLNAVTPELLQQVISGLTRNYAPETIAKSVRLIRMVFSSAVRHQRLVRSPADVLEAPKPSKGHMRILTPGDVENLSAGLPGRYQAIPVVAAATGLRFGELAGLHKSRIDFLRGELTVDQALTEPRGEPPSLKPPKSDHSTRILSVDRDTTDLLAAHIAAHPGDMVFTTQKGGYLRRGSFSRIWRKAVKDTVGEPCRLHDLRHTHAAWLIATGTHPKVIQERLGHGSITVTLDRYGHLMKGLDREAVDRLSAWKHGTDTGQDNTGGGDVVEFNR